MSDVYYLTQFQSSFILVGVPTEVKMVLLYIGIIRCEIYFVLIYCKNMTLIE